MTRRLLKAHRGRPFGWRKPDAHRRNVVVRLTDQEHAKLIRIARREKISMSSVFRSLIAEAR